MYILILIKTKSFKYCLDFFILFLLQVSVLLQINKKVLKIQIPAEKIMQFISGSIFKISVSFIMIYYKQKTNIISEKCDRFSKKYVRFN